MTTANYQPQQQSATFERVRVFDTTLRDGEQSPGATLNSDEKLEIALQLARLGVDVIEAGFPASSPDDLKAVRRIAATVGQAERLNLSGDTIAPPSIAALARANRRDIDMAWQGVNGAKVPCIHVVLPTSDIHIEHKLGKTYSEILKITRRAVGWARDLCDTVEFSAEDATRSNKEFLLSVLETAAEAGAATLNIPDTVGYAMPEEYGGLILHIHRHCAVRPGVVISAHCHDDLGVATANTLAGVANGCRQVEVTINGIGERAGNACLAETVMALHTRNLLFNLTTDIDRKEISATSTLVSRLTGIPVQPNKAVVGANAFAHESGIHQDGMLKDRRTYEVMDAADVGLGQSRLVLGKHSGRNALRARLMDLGYILGDKDLNHAFWAFKQVAYNQKTVSDLHLHNICAQLALSCREPVQ